MVNGKKTSGTSENEPIMLRMLLEKGYSGRELRYWFLSRHYRKPIRFSWTKLENTRNTLNHLDAFVHKLHVSKKGPTNTETDQIVYDLRHHFTESMDDDFNVAPALAALFQFIRKVNRLMDRVGISDKDKEKFLDVLKDINAVMGIMNLEPTEIGEDLQKLVQKREAARKQKDWKTADQIRAVLKEKGIEIIDTDEGPMWRVVN
jgi:cysteinyl-tRNA synthetase